MKNVYIIDDDASVRKSMKRLMTSAGLDARTFESPTEFLDANPPSKNACLVMDI